MASSFSFSPRSRIPEDMALIMMPPEHMRALAVAKRIALTGTEDVVALYNLLQKKRKQEEGLTGLYALGSMDETTSTLRNAVENVITTLPDGFKFGGPTRTLLEVEERKKALAKLESDKIHELLESTRTSALAVEGIMSAWSQEVFPDIVKNSDTSSSVHASLEELQTDLLMEIDSLTEVLLDREEGACTTLASGEALSHITASSSSSARAAHKRARESTT